MNDHSQCLSCDCTFSTGCKAETRSAEPPKGNYSYPRPRRGPAVVREIAKSVRLERIANGEPYYRKKELT